MIRLNKNGDTIVEVLIAIAIVGMVLGGAYASANRSLQSNRRSQERAEALKVAEQQLERLQVSSRQDDTIFTGSANFCLDANLAADGFNGVPPADYNSDNYSTAPAGTYPAQCQIPQAGYNYNLWVQRSGGDTFNVRVRWDGVGGLKQQVQVNYRLHQ